MPSAAASVHPNWPAATIEWVPIDDLIPYIRNPRQHSAEQITQLAASMIEFGWTVPILRGEDGIILAGHGRVQAAKKLGAGWELAPTMTARGWDDAKKRAYVIVDNKLALNASWDAELLTAEIEFLHDAEYDISLLGFSDEDMSRMADDMAGDLFAKAQQPAQEGDAVPRSTSTPDQVGFEVTMTVAQRETCFQAISAMKRNASLDQSGEALWLICQQFLELQ